jgi:hypothetical protein
LGFLANVVDTGEIAEGAGGKLYLLRLALVALTCPTIVAIASVGTVSTNPSR